MRTKPDLLLRILCFLGNMNWFVGSVHPILCACSDGEKPLVELVHTGQNGFDWRWRPAPDVTVFEGKF